MVRKSSPRVRRERIPPPALPPYVRRVAERLRAGGERALLAGGCVRDHLLGRAAKDFDIATSATPDKVAALFPKTVMVGAQFGVARVIDPDGEVEVARFRADLEYRDGRHPVGVVFSSEEEDAKRRDFTVNGLFYDLEAGEVVDHVGGLDDLAGLRLRAIGDARERYREDRLRMLRAVRFGTVLGFDIEERTWEAILAEAGTVLAVSGERIRDELAKILVHPRRELGFFLLSDSGLMEAILPEVERMRGVAQPPEYHPEGDVHRHTALVLAHLVAPTFAEAMGALLHDVGKPATYTVTDRIRFNHHEKVGAEMAEEICTRLRLSRDEIDEVVYIVARHMVFASLPEMRTATRKRVFQEPHFAQVIRHGFADCLGSHRDITLCEWARDAYAAFLAEPPPPEPLVRGRDLIDMGIQPGPVLGRILRRVEDARLEGILGNREAALAWVRERLAGWLEEGDTTE